MEYDGYNGRLTVDGQVLLLSRRGLAAKVGGLSTVHPRRIPLEAVSGVNFRPATRVTNGYLTLGLGGAAATVLGMTSAASDPNTVLFRWKDQARFQSLYAWLRSVVDYNVANRVDCAAVPYDLPAPMEMGRVAQESGEVNEWVPASDDAAPEGEHVLDAPGPTAGGVDYRTAPPPTGPAIPVETGAASGSARLNRRQRSDNRAAFNALALAAASGDPGALDALPAALEQTRRNWRGSKLEATLWEVLATAVQHVGADDVLTADEEARLVGVAGALGLTFDGLRSQAPSAFEQLVVCRINDGRPPALQNAPILIKRGEVAYGSFSVSLMKEVVRREFRGGSSGVSIPIGFGIRYRTGSVRGRSVIVGTDLVPEDGGVLVITSARAVFVGSKKTLEFRHDRLVGVQQYVDGLRLNVTNRQTASLFKFAKGDSPTIAVALIVHAASES